jgi:hypothetical protein
MKVQVRNRLARLRQAGHAEARRPRSWVLLVGVGSPRTDGRIRVARIVVPRRFVESGGCFGEDDDRTESLTFVDTVDDVDEAVRACGGDPACLGSPWRNGFPLWRPGTMTNWCEWSASGGRRRAWAAAVHVSLGGPHLRLGRVGDRGDLGIAFPGGGADPPAIGLRPWPHHVRPPAARGVHVSGNDARIGQFFPGTLP